MSLYMKRYEDIIQKDLIYCA